MPSMASSLRAVIKDLSVTANIRCAIFTGAVPVGPSVYFSTTFAGTLACGMNDADYLLRAANALYSLPFALSVLLLLFDEAHFLKNSSVIPKSKDNLWAL